MQFRRGASREARNSTGSGGTWSSVLRLIHRIIETSLSFFLLDLERMLHDFSGVSDHEEK